jgi:hypothetical protein
MTVSPGPSLVLALAGVLAAPPLRAQSSDPDLGWIDRAAVDGGEVAVRTGKAGALVVTVDVVISIDAPPEPIWDVLTSCEIAPEIVPNVVSCERLEVIDGGRAELFIQTVKPAFFIPSFEHVFRLDYTPYRRIDVSRVSGIIETMQGSWWLIPQPNRSTLLVYHLELDPGVPVPRFFVRAALKRDLPRVVRALRERAETGG